ncbi:hypothetical protein [Mucilaginibacter sp. SJ]|uniref:hypothetical protein n=1 Tax=Mucilaginibacter sp. SJ TaxID=3029053 RepID=UPI0023A9462B|nr:hypothetical protein [Mucilaginibacter sp. SJ]WEA01112.1 hypothetical protein MusilaSJ_27020 [Mucilaginibacter sp. SJ]
METIHKPAVVNNDDSDLHNDELGENTGDDTIIAEMVHLKADEKDIGSMPSSNKGQGPAGEDL